MSQDKFEDRRHKYETVHSGKTVTGAGDSGRNRRREKIRRLYQSERQERDSDVVLRAHSRAVESRRICGKVSVMANGRFADNSEFVEAESKGGGGKVIQNRS